ncbi:MAG: hypothetical protein GY925_21025 [Actinomycetia bacterium]|nr:hypothetical protein [Actinomycetes bacterium]
MARTGRPSAVIDLSDDERATLERWARRHKTSQALARRCRIVLACASGATNNAVDRLEGLRDAPRPGAERTIGDDKIEQVVVDTLETAPPGEDTHWSTRGLAKRHGLSKTTIADIWRAFGLKRWVRDEFKISPDPDLIEKTRDSIAHCCSRIIAKPDPHNT